MFRYSPFLILSLFSLCWMACQSGTNRVDSSEPLGKKVYATKCRLCHGANGQLGLNGATNLAQSTLPKPEAVEVITHGRNMMQPFESLLTEEQIDAVTEYILTLRNTP